jgi:hypothetical protein
MAGRTLKDKANYVSIVRAGVWGTVQVWTTKEANGTGNLHWGEGSWEDPTDRPDPGLGWHAWWPPDVADFFVARNR